MHSDITIGIGMITAPLTTGYSYLDSSTMDNSTYTTWAWGCRIITLLDHIVYYANQFSILAITIDRFLYIRFPFKYDEIMTKYVATIILILIWLCACLVSFIFIFTSNVLEKGYLCFSFNVVDPNYVFYLEIPLLLMVVVAMVVFYGYAAYIAVLKAPKPAR